MKSISQRERAATASSRIYVAYKHCLELFAQNCRKTYLHNVTREDILAFIRKLYDAGCGPRTAYNRAVVVCQLLKLNGITGLLHKCDWPLFPFSIPGSRPVIRVAPSALLHIWICAYRETAAEAILSCSIVL